MSPISDYSKEYVYAVFSKQIIFSILNILLSFASSLAQGVSIPLSGNQILILKDSVIVPRQDTVILLKRNVAYKIKPNPYAKSEAFYDSLRSRAYRSNLTRQLHHLLIRSPTQNMYDTDSLRHSEVYFQAYKGRPIRELSVVHVPVFEGNVSDTGAVMISKIGAWINKTKRYTKPKLILSNVLFREGEKVDPFILADSERILRRLPYIEDARIYLIPDSLSEAVEVKIIVKDRFPWSLGGEYNSLQNFRLALSNLNIQGSGNQLHGSYVYNQDESPKNGYELSFISQPFGITFIQTEISLANNWQEKSKKLRVYKDFLSPEMHYGGEMAWGNVDNWSEIRLEDTITRFEVHRRFWDSWFGKAFLLPTRTHRISLIPALRYMNTEFLERPQVKIDSNEQFHQRELILGALNFQKVNFLKTNYILSFGITEDVPIGYMISGVYGKDITEFRTKNYSGGKVSWSHYFTSVGYLSLAQEGGTFWDKTGADNTLFISTLRYFSPLLQVRRARVRNFIRFQYTLSNNLGFQDRIILQEEIRGLQGVQNQGEFTFTGRLESVWFMPWFFYGFRFAPFIFYDFVKLSREHIQQIFDIDYGGLGAGFRIRNESLVFKTLEFHASWNPNPPAGGKSFNMEFSISTPLAFENFFNIKPRILFLE